MDRVLFVDDEKNILSSLKRQFRKQYHVSTALGGAEGLRMIANEPTYAVVVADMQMPEMNGVEFLRSVKQSSADSVRLMLTGNADQQTAIEAVNEGSIFRFLNKPCPPDKLGGALEDAIAQHRLITAEKELLEGTLSGAIRLLTDILSVVAPEDFRNSLALQEVSLKMAEALAVEDTWNLEFSALFSNVAYVTIPPQTRQKIHANQALTATEKQMVSELPEVGAKLIGNIPRLEKVAEIIRYQAKNYDGSGYPADGVSGTDIPLESRVLRVLSDVVQLKSEGLSESQAMYEISQKRGIYDPVAVEAATSLFGKEKRAKPIEEVPSRSSFLHGLNEGDLITSNIETIEGTLLYSAGNRITPAVLELIFSHHKIVPIKEPIQVAIAPRTAEAALSRRG